MFRFKPIFTVILLCFCRFCFGNTMEEPVFSNKETLYSTKNGSAIGELLLSIEPKNANATNNEWILIIGEKGDKFFEARNAKTLWIFNKKVNVNTFKRDMRNRDYPLEVKDLSELMPFCENGIRFDIKDWDELRNQTQVSFFINASPGQKVTLRLVFYTASSDSKKTTIDDEAKVKIEFEVPTASSRSTQTQQGGGVAAEGELISLTEKIDPVIAAQKMEAEREDSIMRAEAANTAQRMALLNAFITDRNLEINELQEEVNAYLADKKTFVSETTIDSILTVADEMKNKVEYWEKGYSEILLTDEGIHDKFSKFRIAHTLTIKKIEELKQQQQPFNDLLDFIKKNILLSLGIGVGGLVFMKIALSLFKKLTSLIKSKINQKIGKMKTDATKKVKTKTNPKSWRRKKKETDDEFENIDINDLAQI